MKVFDKNHNWDEIDELQSKVAQFEKAIRDYNGLWRSIDAINFRLNKLEKPQSIGKFIKSWIKKWLGV